MYFISSFVVINVVALFCLGKAKSKGRLPYPTIFLCIPASAADAAAVNPEGINTLLANSLIIFIIRGSPVFSNGPRSLPRNPSDCTILHN